MLDNEQGEQFHPGASERCGDGPGFFSNRDIAYVFTGTSRGYGELLVLRGRRDFAPRAAHAGGSSATGRSASTSPPPSA